MSLDRTQNIEVPHSRKQLSKAVLLIALKRQGSDSSGGCTIFGTGPGVCAWVSHTKDLVSHLTSCHCGATRKYQSLARCSIYCIMEMLHITKDLFVSLDIVSDSFLVFLQCFVCFHPVHVVFPCGNLVHTLLVVT